MFNQSLGKLEGRWNYTPPLTGCASLRAVTHSSEECNLCVCLLTQALCSEPQEGHVPSPSQFQFPIKVNTVWKCSHTLAQYDGSWFEFSGLIKERVWEWSLFCSYTHMICGASRITARHMLTSEKRRHTEQRELIKTKHALRQWLQTHTLRHTCLPECSRNIAKRGGGGSVVCSVALWAF